MVHLAREATLCPACRAPLAVESRFCPGCGRSTDGDTVQVPVPAAGRGSALQGAGAPLFAAFVLLLAALVFAAALGQWLISLLLVPVVLTLGVAVAMVAWGDIEEPMDRLVQHAAENLWSAGRVVRVSVTSWTRASRMEATVRARRRRLRLRHERLLRDLGEAVYVGDPRRIEAARAAALASGAEIEQCTTALNEARTRATKRVQSEREATAPTQTFTAPAAPLAPQALGAPTATSLPAQKAQPPPGLPADPVDTHS